MLAATLFVACDGLDPGSLARLEIVQPDTIRSLNAERTLTAAAHLEDGTVGIADGAQWHSFDPSVLTVDSGGTARAVAPGTALVAASIGQLSDTAFVVVHQRIHGIAVLAPRDSLHAIDDTVRLAVMLVDSGGTAITDRTVTWSSSDANVLTVDSAGLVTAQSNGAAVVHASAEDTAGSVTMTVRQRGVRLILTRQPAGASQGAPLAVQPIVEVRDMNGFRVARDSSTLVTASVHPTAGTLSGSVVIVMRGGEARYAGLTLSGPAGAYQLLFGSAGLEAVASDPFQLPP